MDQMNDNKIVDLLKNKSGVTYLTWWIDGAEYNIGYDFSGMWVVYLAGLHEQIYNSYELNNVINFLKEIEGES